VMLTGPLGLPLMTAIFMGLSFMHTNALHGFNKFGIRK